MKAGIIINDIDNFIALDSTYRNASFISKKKIEDLRYLGTFKSYNNPYNVHGGENLVIREVKRYLLWEEGKILPGRLWGIGPVRNLLEKDIQITFSKGNARQLCIDVPVSVADSKTSVYFYDYVPGLSSTDNCGIQIFDENGSLVFENNKKYLHIVDSNYIAADLVNDANINNTGILFSQFSEFTSGGSYGWRTYSWYFNKYSYNSITTRLFCYDGLTISSRWNIPWTTTLFGINEVI